MATAQDIITQSLLKLGIYAPGDTISSADIQQGFTVLNDMLDSWSNESLACYAILEQTGTLQVGVTAYTIGSGGTFNMTRPLRIIPTVGSAYLIDTSGNKYMLDVVERDRWNQISLLNQTTNIPTVMFYDPQYPLGIINIWPTPSVAYAIYWDSYLQLADFGTLTSTMSFPPGYKKALQDCLTLELAPYFKTDSWQPPALLVQQASVSRANIKRTNARLLIANYDPEIVSRANGTYDIYRDSSSR